MNPSLKKKIIVSLCVEVILKKHERIEGTAKIEDGPQRDLDLFARFKHFVFQGKSIYLYCRIKIFKGCSDFSLYCECRSHLTFTIYE